MGFWEILFGTEKKNIQYFGSKQGGDNIPPYEYERARKGETKKEKLERQLRNLQMKYHFDKWNVSDPINIKREEYMKKKYGKNYIPNYDQKLWNEEL